MNYQDTNHELIIQMGRLQRVESGELGSMRVCSLATRETVACAYWKVGNPDDFAQEASLLKFITLGRGMLNPESVYIELTSDRLATARIGLIEKELAHRVLPS